VDERRCVSYSAKTLNKEGAPMMGRRRTNYYKFTVSKRALLKDLKVADKLSSPRYPIGHSALEE